MKRHFPQILKADTLRALGGSARAAARALRITPQAVYAWGAVLSERVAHRVVAGLFFRAEPAVQEAALALLFRGHEPGFRRALAAVHKAAATPPAA